MTKSEARNMGIDGMYLFEKYVVINSYRKHTKKKKIGKAKLDNILARLRIILVCIKVSPFSYFENCISEALDTAEKIMGNKGMGVEPLL
ncbi:hypothetical protein D9M68_668170 [compost metagenome]